MAKNNSPSAHLDELGVRDILLRLPYETLDSLSQDERITRLWLLICSLKKWEWVPFDVVCKECGADPTVRCGHKDNYKVSTKSLIKHASLFERDKAALIACPSGIADFQNLIGYLRKS